MGLEFFSVSPVLPLLEHAVCAGLFRGHGQSQHGDRSQKQDEPKPDIPVRSKYKEQVFPPAHNTERVRNGENMGRGKKGETELWRRKCPEG